MRPKTSRAISGRKLQFLRAGKGTYFLVAETIFGGNVQRLAFVIPYTGTWPKWSRLFFESVGKNPGIDILLLCENRPPFAVPANVKIRIITKDELTGRFIRVTGLPLTTISGHKLCDFRPFFGLAFADLLQKYEFWGYCDIDLIFGDLRKLLTPEFYDSIDVFSAHDKQVVGHFTIVRNMPALNNLAFEIENWQQLCMARTSQLMDENAFSTAILSAPGVRWKRTEPIDEELKKPFCSFGITFGFSGEVAGSKQVLPMVAQISNGKVVCKFGAAATEALYIHFMGLKRAWHWRGFPKITESSYRLTRIGYGGPASSEQLLRFPWRQLWWLQCLMQNSKSYCGTLLRSLLPETVFLSIRRRVFGASRY